MLVSQTEFLVQFMGYNQPLDSEDGPGPLALVSTSPYTSVAHKEICMATLTQAEGFNLLQPGRSTTRAPSRKTFDARPLPLH